MRTLVAPLGRLAPPTAPALGASSVTLAGMLMTNQCQKPEPVGASGSYTVTAKLLVSFGAPLHLSAGDLFSPEQPNTLASNFLSIVELGLMSGLVSANPAACESGITLARALSSKIFFMWFSFFDDWPPLGKKRPLGGAAKRGGDI